MRFKLGAWRVTIQKAETPLERAKRRVDTRAINKAYKQNRDTAHAALKAEVSRGA